MLQIYENLYLGEIAGRNQKKIVEKLKAGKLQPQVYVITPPLDGPNLLEIYPSAEFLIPPFKTQDRLIVGVAVTYWEALEVVRKIFEERFREEQGGLCWQ